MNVSQSIAALSAALVHPSAMDTDEGRARHEMFLARTLVIGFAALAVGPFFLAFHGAPSLAQTALFSFCLAPLAAVMIVAKSGRISQGHLVCVCYLIGTGVTASMTGEASLGCAVAWLIVAQTESLLSLDRRLVGAAAAVSGFAFAALGVAAVSGWMPVVPSSLAGDLAVGMALAIAALNVVCIVILRGPGRDEDQIETKRAKAVAEALDDLVVTFDAAGSVDFIGRGCERVFGLPDHALLGRGLFEHVHVADRPMFLKAAADAARGAPIVTATFRLRTWRPEPGRDGSSAATFLWIEMRARHIEGSGAVALMRDVSESRRAALDLDAAQKAVEAASRSKEHFLANMSHELRTPLNAIIGFSEMLQDPELRPKDPAKQSEYARIIHQSGQHLLAVVNSILDISKIQSGTFSIDPEPFAVAPLVESCCDIITLKAQEGGIEIVRTGLGLVETVVGDRRACKQILINLLSNAIKFTPKNGRVTIVARPEGTALSLSVSDTGIGINAEDLLRLGDPFFQAKSALDRPYEGTGLGLSVVRGLVGLHGGSMSIESEPGRGTSVTVRLPLDCRFVTPSGGAPTIETSARRRPQDLVAQDRFAVSPHAKKVKRIA